MPWMARGLVGLFSLFLSVTAFAENLIISDIDDTIKISHVLNKSEAADNASRWENQFLGMADLYRELAITQAQSKIVYLSNAPSFLMGKNHQLFLKNNSFPDGKLLLRDNLLNNNFKLETIRQLIKEAKPKQMILIGDNGEADAKVYAQIRKEHPAVRFFTYIHQPYSLKNASEKGQPLQEGQLGFVTSVDLAKIWVAQRFITAEQFASLLEKAIPRILNEGEGLSTGELAFPRWLDCRGAMRVFPMDLLSAYQQRLAERCSRR